jgi:hypothetical protein
VNEMQEWADRQLETAKVDPQVWKQLKEEEDNRYAILETHPNGITPPVRVVSMQCSFQITINCMSHYRVLSNEKEKGK